MEGDDERDQRVDQRIDRREQAARQLQRHVGGDHQRRAELEVALDVEAFIIGGELAFILSRRLLGAGRHCAHAAGDLDDDEHAERAGGDDGANVRRRGAQVGEPARTDERGRTDGGGGAPQIDGDAARAPQEAPQLEAEQHQRRSGRRGPDGSATW